jgi:hypothetical protein
VLFASETQNQKESQDFSKSRDGSSLEKAIIVKYTGDYVASIGQEYEYLEAKFGIRGKDWRLTEQRLKDFRDKVYDEMVVEIRISKEVVVLYFDITEPYRELNKQLSPIPK